MDQPKSSSGVMKVETVIQPGHYYSPIVNPAEVRDYVAAGKAAKPEEIKGIDFHLPQMMQFWIDNANFISTTPFTEEKVAERRFYYKDSQLPYGDAVTLRAMIGAHRPKRMIEIGSGFSSACALDTADELGLADFQLTCIDPYPERLKSLLLPNDLARIEIIQKPVQTVELDRFFHLQSGDILFIDSSHVLKTGSDVHFELFHILPSLRSGVFVHFHDCRWPFEYPDPFIFERNYSWNEAYAVRAFLMWNTVFRVYFYGGLFATLNQRLVRETYSVFLKNFGSSLWVLKEGS